MLVKGGPGAIWSSMWYIVPRQCFLKPCECQGIQGCGPLQSSSILTVYITKTAMASFWWYFYQWLYQKSEVAILTTLSCHFDNFGCRNNSVFMLVYPIFCLQRLAWTDAATAQVGRPDTKPTTSWTVLKSVVALWPMSAWGTGIISAYRKSHHKLAYRKEGDGPYLIKVSPMV